MNTDNYQIYETEPEIAEAEERGEPLVYGRIQDLEKLQGQLMNRQQRRAAARKAVKDANRRARAALK